MASSSKSLAVNKEAKSQPLVIEEKAVAATPEVELGSFSDNIDSETFKLSNILGDEDDKRLSNRLLKHLVNAKRSKRKRENSSDSKKESEEKSKFPLDESDAKSTAKSENEEVLLENKEDINNGADSRGDVMNHSEAVLPENSMRSVQREEEESTVPYFLKEIPHEKESEEWSDETCTPSYRFPRKKEPLIVDEFLNNECCSKAPPYESKRRKISDCEKALFDLEDDRYEVDMFRHRVRSAAEHAWELLDTIERRQRPNPIFGFLPNPAGVWWNPIAVEDYLKARDLDCIKELYGRYGYDIVREVRSKPSAVLPLVISRLEKKDKECGKFLKYLRFSDVASLKK